MKTFIETKRECSVEVAVVGGGTAGVFAAISSARTGARTILIEKNSMLGGTVTSASVNFPGLFFAWGEQIIGGPCWEAIERTIELGGAKMPEISYKPEKHWYEQITLNRFVYTYVLHEMCRESGVEVLTNAMPVKASEDEEQVLLLVGCKDGAYAIHSKIVVDATGDANLTQLLGYPCEKSVVQQPATLQNHISNYNFYNIKRDKVAEALLYAQTYGLSESVTTDQVMHYLWKQQIDIHTSSRDADTSVGKTQLEYDALSDLMKWYRFLRTIEGLEELSVDFIAEETGVRETNRIIGEGQIIAEDYLRGDFYDDSVCYSFYPIDLHVEKGIEQTHLQEGVVPKIPYRALIPQHAKRILCAGRMVSSDKYANSAVRVQASCMAMGQVAGCAAAICANTNQYVSDVDYKQLCRQLKNLGAITPEKKGEGRC